MNCKYLKQKLNRKLECKLNNKIITFKDCNNCKYKEYDFSNTVSNSKRRHCTAKDSIVQQKTAKTTAESNNHQISKPLLYKENMSNKTAKMKNKSNKLAKLERNRTSLFTDDLTCCIICGKPKNHLHEIFFGKNRINSIKYKLVIPVCFDCHFKIHNNIELQNEWFIKGQTKFNEVYPELDFVEIFGKNWL